MSLAMSFLFLIVTLFLTQLSISNAGACGQYAPNGCKVVDSSTYCSYSYYNGVYACETCSNNEMSNGLHDELATSTTDADLACVSSKKCGGSCCGPRSFCLASSSGNSCTYCYQGYGKSTYKSDSSPASSSEIGCGSCPPGSRADYYTSRFSYTGSCDTYSSFCSTCPAGTFRYTADAKDCYSCPPNTYSGTGASSCTACPAYKKSDEGAKECYTDTFRQMQTAVGVIFGLVLPLACAFWWYMRYTKCWGNPELLPQCWGNSVCYRMGLTSLPLKETEEDVVTCHVRCYPYIYCRGCCADPSDVVCRLVIWGKTDKYYDQLVQREAEAAAAETAAAEEAVGMRDVEMAEVAGAPGTTVLKQV